MSTTRRVSLGPGLAATWNSGSGGICGRALAPGGWTTTSRSRASGPTCIALSTASVRPLTSSAAKRDAAAAKRFFRKALAQPHTINPRTITVDRNPAYPRATAEMKQAGELWRFSRRPVCKYLNNIVEQDHRRMKRLVRPGLGFPSLPTARRTLAGYEAMAMIRKGQVHNISGSDMQAQSVFVASIFSDRRLNTASL